VLVEKFDATGVMKAQVETVSNPLTTAVNDNWVTMSPKKRVKAMIQAKHKGNSILNPFKETKLGGIGQPSSSTFTPLHNPALLGPDDIILANPMAFKIDHPQATEADPLDAINAGMEDANLDEFLNLQNFEDVDMSSDSSKGKRLEEGKQASSHGPI